MARRAYLALIMLFAAARCERGRHEANAGVRADAAPSRGHVPFEFAGCAVVRTGPRCELGIDRKLTVWAPGGEPRTWTLTADTRPITSATEDRVQDGWRVTFEVPAGTRRLSACEGICGIDGQAIWSLAVSDARVHAEVDELLKRGKQGEYQQASARLKEIVAKGDNEIRGPAEAALGRLELARGNLAQAEPALRSAMAAAKREGRLSDEMRDASTLIWACVELEQRFADARAVIATLTPAGTDFAEGRALLAFNQGLIAMATGDLRGALVSYRNAEHIAQRLVRTRLAGSAAEEVARILTMIGRAEEAVEILEHVQPEPDPCARATWMVNRAWAMTEASAHNPATPPDKVAAAQSAAREATSACPDRHRQFIATINAAEYLLEERDPREADGLIRDIEAEQPGSDVSAAIWRADVLGRWSLARQHPRVALAHFEEQSHQARAVGLAHETFRAEVGAGRALLALGRRDAAVGRFKRAQSLLETSMAGIPLGEGRGAFLSGHSDGVRYLIDALVDGGHADEAMRVARLTRSAELRLAARLDRVSRLSAAERLQLDESLSRYGKSRRALEQEAADDWKLPRAALERVRADREIRAQAAAGALDQAFRLLVEHDAGSVELARPARGQVHLAFFRGTERWIGFAQTPNGTRAVRFPLEELQSGDGAAAVLARFSPELSAARRVRVFASGQSDAVDWHATSWRGAPLIASLEVEYGFDVGVGLHGAQPPDVVRPRSALVLADPMGDLPGARAEAGTVVQFLADWRVERLEGRAATRDALLAELPRVDFLHYAGHAEQAATGTDSGALRLADGSRVDLGDLLALPRVPPVVVLSACEAGATAFTEGRAQGSMIGLAQAFVASGARAVVAPTRPIGDADARMFMSAFYAALTRPGVESVPAAFKAASTTNGSHSFRLMVQ
jgi:tetratricopeptide (TPR) repeat protein